MDFGSIINSLFGSPIGVGFNPVSIGPFTPTKSEPVANASIGPASSPYGSVDQKTGAITPFSSGSNSGGGGSWGGNSGSTSQLQQLSQTNRNPVQETEYQRLLNEQKNSAAAQEQRVRDSINGGYNAYFQQLDSMLGGLDPQKSAQEGVVNNNYNQSVTDLGTSRDQSQSALDRQRGLTEQNQSKNLRDLADNIINSMTAGNVFLGSRGAGDSSAANQYSYALTKLGSKQRTGIVNNTSNILNDIGDRESQLNNVYTTELGRLNTDKENKLLGVSQWFAEAQNQIKGMVASGKLNQGKDLAQLSSQLLNNALQQIAAIDQDNRGRRDALEQWALNNSQNVQGLQSNLQSIGSINPTLPQAAPITGTPSVDASGNFVVPTGLGGGGGQDDQMRNLLNLFR